VEGGFVALANGEADFPFSGGVVAPRGDAAGVVVAAGSEENIDFTGVVAGASRDADGVAPNTVVPVPLVKLASPPVFQAGTESGLFDAAWPNADSPPEANAPNPPPALTAGAADFVSTGFVSPNVASPPDANAPNPPPNVEDVVLMGVTIGVVDIGVPRPVLANPDWPNPG
jgi:hypothetical protein